MFRKWYVSRLQKEIEQRGIQIAEQKTRAASTSEALRAEHRELIAAAEGKGRDLHLRLEELRTSTSGSEHYAELRASVETAREGFGNAVRAARRFA